MKKIVLSVILCCAFSAHGIATNSDAKLNDIEIAQEKINALKSERENIKHKCSPILDEIGVISKKTMELKDKIKSLERNPGACTSAHLKSLLEKAENDIKLLTLSAAYAKLSIDIDKINISIDKANIELIKAEIKARKSPKIPLEVAKALIKREKALVKYCEAGVKVAQAEVKEKDAKIKYLETYVKIADKNGEIRKDTNDSYGYITNIEVAELTVKAKMLQLKFDRARKETAQAQITKSQAGAEFGKINAEFCKSCLKFEKAIDKKNFKLCFNHE